MSAATIVRSHRRRRLGPPGAEAGSFGSRPTASSGIAIPIAIARNAGTAYAKYSARSIGIGDPPPTTGR
jgi:hypothetical protein